MAAFDELADEALLKAIAGGAAWAMEDLYKRYSRMLYSLALRIVGDHQVAEDLVQETLLAVWRRATSYSPQSGTARGWLFAILHHRAIDYLRSTRYRSVIKEASIEQVELDERAAFPDVWDSVWQSVQISLIRAALMKLSPAQRSAIELAYFQG